MKKRVLIGGWLVLAVLANLIPGLLPAAADLPEKSPRTVEYDIKARLDPEAHTVTGSATIKWRNDSPVAVSDVHLHLYLNAFKDKWSTFIRESAGSHRGHRFNAQRPGSIEITSFKTAEGTELQDKQEFVQPDDGNKYDTTVVRVPLPKAIAAGATATWRIEWTSTLPRVFARTGHAGDFHMVAQWYPKPGVWEQTDAGDWAWNCHQFHGSSEFYSDYGVYTVRLRVPESYRGRVGASGARQQLGTDGKDELEHDDGTITYEHRVSDVHDFAWVAGRDFLVFEETFDLEHGIDPDEAQRVAKILGRDPKSLALSPVQVTFLLQPEHEAQLGRHKRAIWSALTYLGLWYGNYPYPTLTVVDPDHRGRDAGGMEYPTLITGGTRIVRAAKQLSPEGVLVHEFAHQHFYGLVGTNEFESAWMDEGFTTYATARVLMKAYDRTEVVTWYGGRPFYGERPIAFSGVAADSRIAMPALARLFDDHLKMPFGELGPIRSIAKELDVNHPPDEVSLWADYGEVSPLTFLREAPVLSRIRPLPATSKQREQGWVGGSPIVDPIDGRKAWEYMNRRSYGLNSYGRPSSSLRTLEGLVGEETMTRIMRTYAERYRFKHPKPKDFFATAAEVAAADGKGTLDWFFEDVFQSARPFDFGIEAIETVDAPKPKGHEGDYHGSIVTVRRFGGVRIPMDIWVGFGDGSEIRKLRWERDDTVVATDGGAAPQVLSPARGSQSDWVKLYFEGPKKVTVAEVDPGRRYGLDRDRTNDGKRTEAAGNASWSVALRALAWTQMTTSFYGGL